MNSGIHRLFAGVQSSQEPLRLESVTEESHTFDLLWPELDALLQPQDQVYPLHHGNPSSLASAAASFDDRGALDIQIPRDIRIIVAQKAYLSHPNRVLYDTHPPPLSPIVRLESPTDAKAGITGQGRSPTAVTSKTNTSPEAVSGTKHIRFWSLSLATKTPPLEQSSPPLPLVPAIEDRGVLGNPRSRRTNNRPVTSDGETAQSRLAREGKEELEILLDCMFGTPGMLVESGTKLHVRPLGTTGVTKTSQNDRCPMSPEQAPFQGNGRRSTPLTRSTTADSFHQMSTSAPAEHFGGLSSRSQSASIVITRLFTIDSSESLAPHMNGDGGQESVPKPEMRRQDSDTARRSSGGLKLPGAKRAKSPGYAISLVLRLPSASQQGWSSASRMTSPISPESMEPATDSARHEFKPSDVLNDGADRDIEQVFIQWALLTRILDSLESTIREKISGLLTTFSNAPCPFSQASPKSTNISVGDQQISPVKRTTQPFPQSLQLSTGSLQQREDVQREVARHGRRIALVLRTRRVVTGQGRWGLWREEARLVGRWAGDREQNFFFYNLLTAFLGFHLDWMDSLEGSRVRRFLRKSEKRKVAGCTMQQQTVIVSSDKMAARRLIFLLAIFLPATASQVQDVMTMSKFNRSGSVFSPSPPSGIPILRELSLRRTINQRQRGNRSSLGSTALHRRSLSFAGSESIIDGHEHQAFQTSNAQHSRRASAARSIMTPTLPTATSGDSARKSSTTTTATIAPETAIPVAHFSALSRDPLMGTTPTPRPGSSGSLASLSLQHTLHRSDSNEHSNTSSGSQSHGRWGSMVSGFWSNRRESSTEGSDSFSASAEGLGISGVSKMPGQRNSAGALERMVEEAGTVNQNNIQDSLVGEPTPEVGASTTEARAIPERPKDETFPMKLSVDSDGIIDVELPGFDSHASSFGSSVGITSHCHTAPSSFNETSSAFTRSPTKQRTRPASDLPTDTAGWLEEYSPDFVLHAVKPYQGIKTDIERAMRARPVPTEESREWKDVRRCLVADTTTFTITCVCFQRRTVASLDTADQTIEERVTEEPMMDHDPVLIDAVERLLAQSGRSSRVQSRAPSRAPSPSRSHAVSSKTPSHEVEVPRHEVKRSLFGALEEVVRSVLAEGDGETGGKGARHLSGEPVRVEGGEVLQDSTLKEGVRKRVKERLMA
ncbi:MAG: hypothetical protein Q9208_003287 [Pyrenodesmia sp. 3 TL-2023]